MNCENSGDNSRHCIEAWDTNRTLEATFKFIKENQNVASGVFYQTILYLGIALKDSQDFSNYNDRQQVFNIIYGKIIKVKDSYLVMETVSTCTGETQEYTVAYSDIVNVRSDVFSVYFDEYVKYMSKLPALCKSCGDRYYDLIQALQSKIDENNPLVSLYLIYGGNFSLEYSESEYDIVENLVIIQRNGLVPITSITGFFIAPKLLKVEKVEAVKKGGILDGSN